MEEESTHIFFDGNKAMISPDIAPIFSFLIEIEKEVESIMNFQKKLDGINNQYLEMINFTQFLSNKLKENNIDFEYKFKEHPELVAEKFSFHLPVRSQMIVLFASLEVLYFIQIAYEKELDDNDRVKEVATKDKDFSKKFTNSFLLTEENSYYKVNRARLSKIDAGKLRDFRNSLTHFFSLPHNGLSISPGLLNEKARKLENILKQNKRGSVVFISPEDLYELIKSGHILRKIKWGEDFKNNKTDFKRRMQFVINVVKNNGAVIIMNKNLNIK